MSEKKIKHLEFIQSVITRMNSNSFMLKGWAITVSAALFALSASNSNYLFALLAIIPAVMFWFLDSFYLSQEKLFRNLYDNVRAKEEVEVDFSMSTEEYSTADTALTKVMFSKTLKPFYCLLIAISLVVAGFLFFINKDHSKKSVSIKTENTKVIATVDHLQGP